MPDDLKKQWLRSYEAVPAQLEKVKSVGRVATAFNANIDAVVKLSGEKISALAVKTGLTADELEKGQPVINSGKDAVRGLIKCFSRGIAEEWSCEDIKAFEWLQENIGYDRLQMGGQGGIVANAMAVLGVKSVYAHTASHTELQAKQFLDFDNLLAADDDGNMRKARGIKRRGDVPYIHQIMEFDAGDRFSLGGREFVCPKSNRFIATYDPAVVMLKKDAGFMRNIEKDGFDYMILSGYHNLISERRGEELVKETVPLIKKWKADNPQSVIHLELASTQDKKVRKAIIEHIAPLADSAGLNEREALDVLEIIDPEMFEKVKSAKLTAPLLFDILLKIKKKCRTPRIQLHFFGMYITLQDHGFKITPEQNKRGMMLASVVAAAKAGLGSIDDPHNLLWAADRPVSDTGLAELEKLAAHTGHKELAETGICRLEDYDLIAVPTILIEKPLTLVGMGDTISSVSLVGAR